MGPGWILTHDHRQHSSSSVRSKNNVIIFIMITGQRRGKKTMRNMFVFVSTHTNNNNICERRWAAFMAYWLDTTVIFWDQTSLSLPSKRNVWINDDYTYSLTSCVCTAKFKTQGASSLYLRKKLCLHHIFRCLEGCKISKKDLPAFLEQIAHENNNCNVTWRDERWRVPKYKMEAINALKLFAWHTRKIFTYRQFQRYYVTRTHAFDRNRQFLSYKLFLLE